MANREEAANQPVQHVVMAWNAANVPGHRDQPPLHHQYHRLHLLDAARALMLLGAIAAVSAVGNDPADADGDATQVLLGLVTWLLGVGLLSLVPVAGRFPQAGGVGAAIANASAVLVYLLTPWN